MAKIVISFGGNALGISPSEQKAHLKSAAQQVVALIKAGHELLLCHGNGPQVGLINNSFTAAYAAKILSEKMAFPECGAMSQAYIGFHLQNALNNALQAAGLEKDVTTVLTQTIVEMTDPAFQNPTKPIGVFMTQAIAMQKEKTQNWTVKEDAGRGWRRVIASPKPLGFVEANVIKKLFAAKTLVIAGGGGGVPVYQKEGQYIAVDAVIDKDFTSARLAALVEADLLIILTAVKYVKINFGKENEVSLRVVNLEQLQTYRAAGQFAAGSMLPKVSAVMKFVASTKNNAYIGLLADLEAILDGKTGTKIVA